MKLAKILGKYLIIPTANGDLSTPKKTGSHEPVFYLYIIDNGQPAMYNYVVDEHISRLDITIQIQEKWMKGKGWRRSHLRR